MIRNLAIKLAVPIALLAFFLPQIASLPHNGHGTQAPELRILPLGDSITWGWQPNTANGTNGYRAQLQKRLSILVPSAVFVGTQYSGPMANNANEGHPGFLISQIQQAMGPGLELQPNVVLLHAGTNDLNRPETEEEKWADAPKRLGGVLNGIFEVNPATVVLVAKIIQAENKNTQRNIAVFNNAVPKIVASQVAKGQKVTVVDQSVVGVGQLIDGLHPTDEGYAHMGDVWFKGIKRAVNKHLVTAPIEPGPKNA